MPRRKYLATAQFPYHVTNRCNNKEWFHVPLPRVWEIFSDQLSASSTRFSVLVQAFVLMSNHFHLMVLTPLGNLDEFLRHLLTETARRLQRESSRMNHIFGGRSRQSILDSSYSVAYVLKYIYRNPVRAGLCQKVEEYKFSSLTSLLEGKNDISIAEGFDVLWAFIPRGTEERLSWLNLPAPKEQELLITKGLRRSTFRFSTSNSVRRELLALAGSYGIHRWDDPYLLGPEGE